MQTLRFSLLLAISSVSSLAQQAGPELPTPGPDPWFSTFSIIAYDPATGELGVGVQSRAFGSGAAVPYAKAGVGAIATQASTNRFYGPQAIALLEKGVSVEEIVKRITDDRSEEHTS